MIFKLSESPGQMVSNCGFYVYLQIMLLWKSQTQTCQQKIYEYCMVDFGDMILKVN